MQALCSCTCDTFKCKIMLTALFITCSYTHPLPTLPLLSSLSQSIEAMMGVQLSDDIGDWIMDGVLVCQVVNKLHPGTINTIHTTTEGQVVYTPAFLSISQYSSVYPSIPQYTPAFLSEPQYSSVNPSIPQ